MFSPLNYTLLKSPWRPNLELDGKKIQEGIPENAGALRVNHGPIACA